MVEANPFKFYFAKYFFFVFGAMFWLTAFVFLFFFQTDMHVLAGALFFTIGFFLFYIFAIVSGKIRRVAIGKNKIVIIEGERNVRFAWPEVKSLKLVPVFHMYRLKIKGKKKSIYFFPSKAIDPAFGLLAKEDSKKNQ